MSPEALLAEPTAAAKAAAYTRITTLAADRALHRAFHWLHLNELQLRRWQLEFLAIPAPPFGEQPRAEWFCDRFRDLGLANPHMDDAGNALAELPAYTAELNPDPCSLTPVPCILLSAHLDTVFPPETSTTPREDDATIHCPGASDNGAGLAALLALAAALHAAELTPPCTILFAANTGEEGAGDLRGMRHLFTDSPYADRIRAAIALEGSGDSIVDQALGSRRLRVTVSGPGGHSWADAGLPNPIVALSAGLVALDKLRLPASPRTTLNVGTITGGTSINSIPESATADIDLRSTSAAELDRIEFAVLKTLSAEISAQSLRHHEPLTLHTDRIGNRPTGTLPANSPLAHSLRAVDRHLNLRTETRIGSTDANIPLSLGIPSLAIGCGGTSSGIHTLREWYDPTGRELALRRILMLLLDAASLCAGE